MNFESEKQPQIIILNNEPKLSEHDVDAEKNELRVNLVPKIKDFISNNERLKDQDVKVTFSENGVSSLVSIIETPSEKLVLKIPLNSHREGEAQFLEAWGKKGVAVPHVIEEGFIGGQSYLLMEYVNAKTLRENNTYKQMVEKQTFITMGQTLRRMHAVEAEGFGQIINNKPEYEQFKNWLEEGYIQERIQYIQENAIFGDEHGSVTAALEALLAYMGDDTKSTYCHNDFSAYNAFDTDPITVFDPSPSLNNGYLDLGRSIVIAVAHGKIAEAAEQLKKGYFGEESFNARTLQASILLNSYTKASHWHKLKRIKNIENIQKYLIQTKHLLET